MSDAQSFYKIGIAAPNLMVICIDTSVDGKETGRLYSCYSKEPAEFDDPYQLLLMMDEVMERIHFPQASVALRDYGAKDGGRKKGRPEEQTESVERRMAARQERPDKVMEQAELLEYRGGIATYAVRIQYRQYATWQGELVWLEKNLARSFNSELEMLKLMDNMRED